LPAITRAETTGPVRPKAGESQAALIWKGFLKRNLAVGSAVVILILVLVSIFAPLIANDRPIAYKGFNRFQQSESVRNARTIMRLLAGKVAADDFPSFEWRGIRVELSSLAAQFAAEDAAAIEEFRQRLSEPISQLRQIATDLGEVADPLADLLETVEEPRLSRLIAQLEPTLERTRLWTELAVADSKVDASPSKEERQKRRRTRFLTVIRDGQPMLLTAVIEQVKSAGLFEDADTFDEIAERMEQIDGELSAVNSELNDISRDFRSRFGRGDATLVSRWHYPAIESLAWGDVAIFVVALGMVSMVVMGLLPVIGGTTIKRTAWGTILVAGAAGLAWYLTVPERVDRAPYKEGVLAADAEAGTAPVVYDTVMWPPIPFSLDEVDLDAKFAPPPWWKADEKQATEEDAAIDTYEPGRWDGPHWLGTDKIGRDVLSRMIWGGRISLSVGIVAVGIYVAIGIVVGAAAGYFGGWVDIILSRIIEIVIVFPSFFLILTIVAFVGPSIWNIMAVIGLTGWTGVARLVRGEFLRLSGQEFVMAGRALGYPATRIIFRHVLPNAVAPVLVAATFGVAGAILTESALSFLGLGITVPKPSWGGILAEGRDYIRIAPWLIYFPGFAIFITITAYNLVGDTLRDVADPRLRGSR